MRDWLPALGSMLLLLTPVWFGLLARRKKQSGLLWGVSLAFVSLVVGQFVTPRPLVYAYAVGLVICSMPALIALAFIRPHVGGSDGAA
jgi:inner membrane protein involved in colicin E2 resistance